MTAGPSGTGKAVVVDASLALKWILAEPDSAIAQRMLVDWQVNGTRLVAPLLLTAEAANAVYKRVRKNELTLPEAQLALSALLATEIAYDTDPNLSLQALTLAHHYDLRASYDTHYMALAQGLNIDFWTGDRNLINALQGRRPAWLRSISDYPTPPSAP